MGDLKPTSQAANVPTKSPQFAIKVCIASTHNIHCHLIVHTFNFLFEVLALSVSTLYREEDTYLEENNQLRRFVGYTICNYSVLL